MVCPYNKTSYPASRRAPTRSSSYLGGESGIFEAQALTYLRLLDLKLALVINFGEKLVKDGIHRVVNRL